MNSNVVRRNAARRRVLATQLVGLQVEVSGELLGGFDQTRLDLDAPCVETEHGAAILRARPTDGQRRGEIFAPMHWTDRFASAGPVDRLVGAACDPVSV